MYKLHTTKEQNHRNKWRRSEAGPTQNKHHYAGVTGTLGILSTTAKKCCKPHLYQKAYSY